MVELTVNLELTNVKQIPNNKPVGVEALAGGPAATTFNVAPTSYRLKPLLQQNLYSNKTSTPTKPLLQHLT